MSESLHSRWTLLLAVCAAALVLQAPAQQCVAGILIPQPVNFSARDLDEALTPQSGDTAAMSSGSRRASEPQPSEDEDQQPSPFAALGSPLHGSGSSSSSSSTSSGGSVGSSTALCMFTRSFIILDDPTIGRVAEDRSLSLPDPLGADLLRPPRAC